MEQAGQSSEVLRREIEEQSQSEAAGILEQADKDIQALIGQAQAEADRIRKDILDKAEKQAEQIRKRILSGVHLEIKKQHLRNREILLDEIVQDVRKELNAFRSKPDYEDVLIQFVLEGVRAIEGDEMILICGSEESKHLKSIQQVIHRTTGRSIQMRIEKHDSEDGGVLLLSADRRIRYDNRFSARMKRMEQTIRLDVMKTIFEQM